MKKLLTFLSVIYVLLTLTSCSNSEQSTKTEPEITIDNPLESITFFDETYLISEADNIDYDENGNATFVLFNDIGFIGLADANTEPLYQQVKLGQVIGGMTVAEGTSMGFDFINNNWELTESDVRLTGPVTFIGELTKTPEGELQMLAPGTLSFSVTDSENDFIPFRYGDSSITHFTLEGYDPEIDYPELFVESDTVYVKATFDSLRLLKTERATGMNYAELISIELMDKAE